MVKNDKTFSIEIKLEIQLDNTNLNMLITIETLSGFRKHLKELAKMKIDSLLILVTDEIDNEYVKKHFLKIYDEIIHMKETLTSLPPEIGQLTSLKILGLIAKLRKLPSEIGLHGMK